MEVFIKLQAISLTFAILQCSTIASLVNNNGNVDFVQLHNSQDTSLKNTEAGKSLYQISNSISRNRKIGNVIFNDNLVFGASSPATNDNRKERQHLTAERQQRQVYSTSGSVAGGLLQNHRLEGPLSPEETSSAAAAAALSTPILSNLNENDLKLASDNSQYNIHTAANSVAADGASVTGQSRVYSPHNGGWASNSGSCLFSCSTGSYSSASSCCQLNYVQCCPNPHQEQLNFKNLHHGRGYIGGGAGKSGYAWGPSIPYNPPPIVRPKPCQPLLHHNPIGLHAGGAILNKGIETIKHNIHNIGQFFKGHVTSGWTSGGNGAAGAYFHRRSDDPVEEAKHYGINSSKKRRPTRSVHNKWDGGGLGNTVVPCPVYSTPPNPSYGWSHAARPYSVGLGSLIGWSRPGNQIHGGVGYGNPYQYAVPVQPTGGGYGWGGSGSNVCQWDYQCPGSLQCCKGTCQVAPFAG